MQVIFAEKKLAFLFSVYLIIPQGNVPLGISGGSSPRKADCGRAALPNVHPVTPSAGTARANCCQLDVEPPPFLCQRVCLLLLVLRRVYASSR